MSTPADERPRYYVAAEGFGWGVRDRQQGTHPLHVRVAYFTRSDHGGSQNPDSWEAARQAAVAHAAALNADEVGGRG
jgi:hypothetical protein